jgi:aconitate hydratase
MEQAMKPATFQRLYDGIEQSNAAWNAIPVKGGELFDWDDDSPTSRSRRSSSTWRRSPEPIAPIRGARVLVKVGDSVTTDHISPAGSIAKTRRRGAT